VSCNRNVILREYVNSIVSLRFDLQAVKFIQISFTACKSNLRLTTHEEG